MLPTPDVELTGAWEQPLLGFRLHLQTQNRSAGTITNRLCSSTIMARHAVSAGLDDPAVVDYAWLAGYMSRQYQARKRGGPASFYADISALWSWYAGEFKSPSPMEKIKRPAEVMADVPTLTDAQIDALMQATAGSDDESARNRTIVLVLLDSGLRRMELAGLDCGDVELEEPASIRVRRGKGGKPRTALISTRTAQALWRYLRGRADASADAPLFVSVYGHRLTPSGVGS